MRQLIIEGKQTKKKERESTLQKEEKKKSRSTAVAATTIPKLQKFVAKLFLQTKNHTAREKRRHHHHHHAAHAQQINTSKEKTNKQTSKQSLGVEPETLSVRPLATIIGTERSPHGWLVDDSGRMENCGAIFKGGALKKWLDAFLRF